VTSKSSHFLHRRVFPNNDLVKRVAMCADDFVCVFGEHEIANLRTSINIVDWLESVGVPETNASICSSTTTR